MDTTWADENLRVIRMLVERSAVYRRAMSPVLLATGGGGALAGVGGALAGPADPSAFCAYWVAVAVACYMGVAVLNALAWLLTDIPEELDSGGGEQR